MSDILENTNHIQKNMIRKNVIQKNETHDKPHFINSFATECEYETTFADRHIGLCIEDEAKMLAVLGYASRQKFIEATVPENILHSDSIPLGPFSQALSESQALTALSDRAKKNKLFRSYIGQGYYGTITPSVIQRNVLENPAWYTAYTPYQPEISQGRLEALLNFQHMICDLTKLDVANASLLDEATAAAEAMMLAKRASQTSSSRFIVASSVFPQTIDVVRTRACPLNIEISIIETQQLLKQPHLVDDAFGVLVQYPDVDGEINHFKELAAYCSEKNIYTIAAADILALTLLTPPGEWGTDIAIGSTQRFGVPMMFGGPHAAYMAVRDSLKRQLPGRIVGTTIDAAKDPALRLALQTREQHIRREKATSNICTAQALLAMAASFYALYHGPKGLRDIANRIHTLSNQLANGIKQLNFEIKNQYFFDTLTVISREKTRDIHQCAIKNQINLRYIDESHVGISLDETVTADDVQKLLAIFCEVIKEGNAEEENTKKYFLIDEKQLLRNFTAYPENLVRTSKYLTHAVFNSYQSETEMLRYLRYLSDRDLALDRTMIPLGSCTMKLNATTEMLPISWPEFANTHPFVPSDQSAGYCLMISELEKMLAACTGYQAVSLQPNAGSQGEYAGLLIIRAYYESRGEKHRDICLIPSSAHGTNPASAQMAGLNVIMVACDDEGNVDLKDLNRLAEQYAQRLAAIMITYPSTHGVFEAHVRELCEIIHRNGGQVYIDGANMNAMVGLAAPGQFGGDVSHLNLHKTFCIPHGGGGPGVGPVAVASHLESFLPNARAANYIRHKQGINAISATPYGSAGVLPISWMYIVMMGAAGLRRASETAILAANYLAKRLSAHYPILYTGKNGHVAHECILDMRKFKTSANITVEDIAKRLIDYGFHAPTMSFPVTGTLMVEPTESESLTELNRFIDAMIEIRREIKDIEEGLSDKQDNVLKNAPHTAYAVSADNWPYMYGREKAAWPVPHLRKHKYWPPVARVDNAYGDRNLFCSCPPLPQA